MDWSDDGIVLGLRHFDDFQRSLGISRTIVSDRLATLVREEVLFRPEGKWGKQRPYRLTEKGLELYPVVMAIVGWGNRSTRSCTPSKASAYFRALRESYR